MNPSTSVTGPQCTAIADLELTKVLSLQETVTSNTGTAATFGMATQTSDVDTAHNIANTVGNTPPATSDLQQLAIYIDPLSSGLDVCRAIPGNGAGTVSGYIDNGSCAAGGDATPAKLIMSAHLVSNVSSFALGAGGTIGQGSFHLRFVIDYVDTNYLDLTVGGI